MYTENTGKHHRNGLPVWLLPLLVVISFWGVSQNIMVVDGCKLIPETTFKRAYNE
ncbi:hypothetical protein [Lactiplantibacillus plantarum]|uniref:hypothetical protein n=1 Tax=Lactiplantibacillus plantarum TaxID=1590 RepID=UPI001485FA31|nr:hypothetical protein [Lactiplantibacillus plantarum]